MSRVTFYLIACLMVLTTVACVNGKRPRTETVVNIGLQCRSRHRDYVGACITQNLFNGEFGCLNLVCAKLGSDGFYKAFNTGKANDGTPCGPDKACSNGVCIQQQIGNSRETWLFRAGLLANQALPCVVSADPIIVNTARKPTFVPRPPPNKRA